MLSGRYLDQIPDGAIGFLGTQNAHPTNHIGSDLTQWQVPIVSKTATEIVLEQDRSYTLGMSFLGCIASLDGSVIYWINDTSPLPEE